jgi:preprotein translocase subunit SecE
MNKVSWSTWDDLKRATLVVLTTVLVLSLFLLGVDVVWSNLLKALHVLQFDGGGGFGSQAG